MVVYMKLIETCIPLGMTPLSNSTKAKEWLKIKSREMIVLHTRACTLRSSS